MEYIRFPTGFSSQTAWLPYNTMEHHETIDIDHLQDCLNSGRIDEIFEYPDLFFSAFCLAYETFDSEPDDHFSISIHETTLHITGRKHIIEGIQHGVEEIRKHFIQAYDSRTTFYILAVKIAIDFYLKPPAPTIDLIGWSESELNESRICEFRFTKYIQPCMHAFGQLLGVRCSEVVIKNQRIQREKYRPESTQDVLAFKVEWLG